MKIACVALTVLFALCLRTAAGQERISAKEANIAWDPVTTLADGSKIPSGGTVEYEVWIKSSKGSQSLLGVTRGVTFRVVLPGVDTYAVGVRAKVSPAKGAAAYSKMVWSDAAGGGASKPFVLSAPQAQGSSADAGRTPEKLKPKETLPSQPGAVGLLREGFEGEPAGWREVDPKSILNTRDAKAKFKGSYGMSIYMSKPGPCSLKYDIGSDRDAVSIGFWYRTPTSLKGTAWSTFFFVNDGSNAIVTSINIAGNNGKPVLRLFDGKTHTKGPGVSLNKWYWIALKAVRNGSCTLRVYDAARRQLGELKKKGLDVPCRAVQFSKSAAAYGDGVYECFDDFTADWTGVKYPLLGWAPPKLPFSS